MTFQSGNLRIIDRRRFIFSAVILSNIFYLPRGNAAVIDFVNVANALNEAATAVGKLGDSIAHLISLGGQGWDAASARIVRGRLEVISGRLQVFAALPNSRVTNHLDDFIRYQKVLMLHPVAPPFSERVNKEQSRDWEAVKKVFRDVLTEVKELFKSLEKENGNIVAMDFYQKLLDTLGERMEVLDKLSQLPVPTSISELDALEDISKQYKILQTQLRRAITLLNEYLREPT
jgi:hypothetical protein